MLEGDACLIGLWWKAVPYLAVLAFIAFALGFKASLLFYWNGFRLGRFSMLQIQKNNAAAHRIAAEGTALMSGVMCVVSRISREKQI